MKERPILFSGPMVRALLEGRKTQTRRAIKPQPEFLQVYEHKGRLIHDSSLRSWCWNGKAHGRYPDEYAPSLAVMCPYGVPSDQLWVREAWRVHERFSDVVRIRYQASERQSWTKQHEDFPVALAANLKDAAGYKPSIHMPRWASRLTLAITDVRVERLNDISEADALAEGVMLNDLSEYVVPGVEEVWQGTASAAYAELWNHINGPGSWDANPWVWCVSFGVVPR